MEEEERIDEILRNLSPKDQIGRFRRGIIPKSETALVSDLINVWMVLSASFASVVL